jgi:glycosyltransferase involved in cell wall biosynthesis
MHVCVMLENHAKVRMAGAEYQTLLLTEELARRAGVKVTYVARRIPEGTDAEGLPYDLRRVGSEQGIRRRAVFFDAPDLIRTLREIKPDVIYQQSRQSYTAACAWYARKVRIPFFFHIAHDFDLDYRWLTLRLSLNTPFDFVEAVTGIWGLKHASHIIVQTERQGRVLKEKYGHTAAAIIRNFQPFPAALPLKPPGPLKIFWVANLKDWKRPELFVDLAESFAGRTDLEFIMAGRPAGQRRFEPLMQRIPTVPNLKFLGEVPIARVNELMSEAAVHVNTSSFEGFPNTFLQAWGRGAIVATLAVDPDEEGMEALGIGYCAGTLENLHQFIDELSRSPERRQRLMNNAFAFVNAKHSMAQGAQLADLILSAGKAPDTSLALQPSRSAG